MRFWRAFRLSGLTLLLFVVLTAPTLIWAAGDAPYFSPEDYKSLAIVTLQLAVVFFILFFYLPYQICVLMLVRNRLFFLLALPLLVFSALVFGASYFYWFDEYWLRDDLLHAHVKIGVGGMLFTILNYLLVGRR